MGNEKTRRELLTAPLIALFGCVSYEQCEQPVRGQRNDSMLFHTMRAYTDITREQAEEQIVNDAAEIEIAETWAYFGETRELFEVQLDREVIYPPYSRRDATIYSVTSLKEQISRVKLIESLRKQKADIIEKLNNENSILAVPDSELSMGLMISNSTVQARLADHQGIMTVTFEPGLEEKIIPRESTFGFRRSWCAITDCLYTRYTTLLMDFESYKEELKRIGIYLNYTKLKDRSITKADLA